MAPTITIKKNWTKPSTILFASEIPTNEKAFKYALAQARQFGAGLILFHAYDSLMVGASETSISYYDYEAAALAESLHLQPLAERVRQAGVHCEVVVRPGLPADQILAFCREREVDRIVMGTHSPSPDCKLLVGTVAEAVLRRACAPVYFVGSEVESGGQLAVRTVLCAVNMHDSSRMVAEFAAHLAEQHDARLMLQHVIRPQQREEVLAGRSLDDVELDLLSLVPLELHDRVDVQSIVVPGDPTEELLYQSRVQNADLIVIGAQGASAFAAITRNGVVYKTLAHAHCPVMTLSPVVLEGCGSKKRNGDPAEAYMAGIF